MTGDVFQLIGSFFKVLKHYSHNEITVYIKPPTEIQLLYLCGRLFQH